MPPRPRQNLGPIFVADSAPCASVTYAGLEQEKVLAEKDALAKELDEYKQREKGTFRDLEMDNVIPPSQPPPTPSTSSSSRI